MPHHLNPTQFNQTLAAAAQLREGPSQQRSQSISDQKLTAGRVLRFQPNEQCQQVRIANHAVDFGGGKPSAVLAEPVLAALGLAPSGLGNLHHLSIGHRRPISVIGGLGNIQQGFEIIAETSLPHTMPPQRIIAIALNSKVARR